MRTSRTILNSLLATLIFSLGCSTRMPLPSGLANKGLLPLSVSNPYVGSNLFLAKEMEKSTFLNKFISGTGGPTAIKIIGNGWTPTELYLYYPESQQFYVAESTPPTPDSEWIVRGPYRIGRHEYKDLIVLARQSDRPPVFNVFGRTERFAPYVAKERDRVIRPEIPPTPKPTPRPKVIVKKKTKSKSPSGTFDIMQDDFKPLNSDQQAIRMARGFAERSSNGDLVHTVKRSSETLFDIAKWYTGSTDNTVKIAKENGLMPDDSLSPGTRVTIPHTLVKEQKQMPATLKE